MLTYGSYKVVRLSHQDDYRVGMHILEDHYESDESFGSADGFIVSAAIVSYNGVDEDITDPEICEIKFYLKHWDSESTTKGIGFTELEHRICEPEDFNFRNATTKSDVS